MSQMKKSEYLMEAYLLYSSLTLFALGCLTLVLSIFFHSKSRALNSLPKNLTPGIFTKSFVVFDPFPERRRIIHSVSFTLPMLTFLVSIVAALVVWEIIEYGFILSLLIVIIGLNLIVVEGAFEVYQNSRTFIKAFQNGTSFGIGDLNAIQIVKNVLPRIIKYYFGLSIFFIAFSVALPYVLSPLLWFLTRSISLTYEIGASTGAMSFLVTLCLFSLALVIIEIIVSKMKNKFLNYMIE